jgi:glycosyltransferase involved in cell wall biosynthesis
MKVSVCMIAYNHDKYIAQALESILAQKTNFAFEIVIGDDGSKDETRNICERYAQQYPERIRYNRHEKNIGMMPNFIGTLEACRGEYIAICEGDDFWTDNNKLQLQSDYLDSHPDYSFCCHLHQVLTRGKLLDAHKELPASVVDVTTEEYLLHPFFHTTSYFFRRDAQPRPYPAWYYKVLAGDHFLVLFISLKGRMACLNKRMSVFRNHGSSVSFTRTALDIKQNFVRHLEAFDNYSGEKFHETIRRVIRKWDLLYMVYEPVGYFRKIGFLFRNLGFYSRNFGDLGGLKLLVKYFVPNSLLRRLKN